MTAILLSLGASGCWKDDMADDGHIKPYEASPFFADGRSARPLVNGTVPRGHRMINDPLYAVIAPGAGDDKPFEFPLTGADIERGRQQFTIYCAVCHGALGDGNGMIVQRGFPRPPSFYIQRLRDAAPGHYYNVISNGYGAMYSYNDRIQPPDRWKIAGYVRALQLSDPKNTGLPPQNAPAPRPTEAK